MTRVLVVDDERETLEILGLFLELSGYKPCTTLNSEDAIALAEAERPDCVLLDVMMPGLNGFDLCKMMRSHQTTTDLPIMFVTAYAPMDLEERRREAGADLVLMKPFGMDNLIRAVEEVMDLRASRSRKLDSKPLPEPAFARPSPAVAALPALTVRQTSPLKDTSAPIM